MEKIFTFIINKDKKILLLKGNPDDPQFHRSFWYIVTGNKEEQDKNYEDAVIREVKEETNLDVEKIKYLNWILKYSLLGKNCTEYVYISQVNDNDIILNEESIDYKWCDIDEFINMIEWNKDKNELKEIIECAMKWELYFKTEHITLY